MTISRQSVLKSMFFITYTIILLKGIISGSKKEYKTSNLKIFIEIIED